MRHTVATELANSDVSVYTLMKFLGTRGIVQYRVLRAFRRAVDKCAACAVGIDAGLVSFL